MIEYVEEVKKLIKSDFIMGIMDKVDYFVEFIFEQYLL
jgi:hypothetical protein